MESTVVFKKTPQGQEAFSQRSPQLGVKQRSVLIMVDGKRTLGELSRLAAACGDVGALLLELQDMGMVALVSGKPAAARGAAAPASWNTTDNTVPAALEPLASAAPAPQAPVPTAAPAPAPALPRSLKDAQRFAVRQLNDAMGPSAESFCMRIENGKNPAEVLGAVQRAAEMLANVRGKAAAQALYDGVKLRLPE